MGVWESLGEADEMELLFDRLIEWAEDSAVREGLVQRRDRLAEEGLPVQCK